MPVPYAPSLEDAYLLMLGDQAAAAPLFAEAVRRINSGESISSLFHAPQ